MGCGEGALLRNAGVGAEADPKNTKNPLDDAAMQGARSAPRDAPPGSKGSDDPDGPLDRNSEFCTR